MRPQRAARAPRSWREPWTALPKPRPCGLIRRWRTPSPSCWIFPARRARRWRKSRALLKTAGINLDRAAGGDGCAPGGLGSLGIAPEQVQFTAHFGRNMEYYTGFVFELWARDREGPVQVAGGGRYDTLLESLGRETAGQRHRLRHPHRASAGERKRAAM